MNSTETLNYNPQSFILYKSDTNIIKSDWKNSFLGRKQIRILIQTTGELSIQTVAQTSFARLASAFLKVISFGKLKSMGKKITSATATGYLLPSNLSVPLTKAQEKKLFEIQSRHLNELFLPSHKKLNELGLALSDQAIKAEGSQAVQEKALTMNQEILDFQHTLYNQLQNEIHPAELYEKFKAFQAQSEEMCKQYPLILTQFIQESKALDQMKAEMLAKNQQIEENKKKNESELALQLKNTIENRLTLPSTSLLTPQQKYETLLKFSYDYQENLRKRFQFLSADRLEKETGKIKNQLEIENIRVLFSKNKKEILFKSAAEALEDALDTTNESVPYIDQLLALPTNSPYEPKLREIVIFNIRQTIENTIDQLRQKKGLIDKLLENTKENLWKNSIEKTFETLRQTLNALGVSHSGYESSIPGLQSASDWILYWTGAKATRYSLEDLDKKTLAKHLQLVDQSCEAALDLMEKETPKDPIEQLIALKKLSSPFYQDLHALLIKQGHTQLQEYLSSLENYQSLIPSAMNVLPEKKKELERIETRIKEKLLEAKSLTTDYFVRLHFWHLFYSKKPIKELEPEDLKKYLNEINFLSTSGIEEIKQYAQQFGLEF